MQLEKLRDRLGAWPRRVFGFVMAWVITAVTAAHGEECEPAFYKWAPSPPMGWNSWDCFGTTVTEAQTKAQADYMAEHLARYGWRYIVVDIQWYEPFSKGHDYRPNAELTMDEWGRLWPATNKFPSAANGIGFRALADYVHAKGLKFGVHLMRGIPRQAVRLNTPIKGTPYRAADIANTNDTCRWNPDMYGVDMSRPGSQEYYNSVFDLLAEWGVDFVKVDDVARPYHSNEVAAIRRAIDRTGRPIVLSLSPGETPLSVGPHVMRHANMWRISDDFWDRWPELLAQFERLNKWSQFLGDGHYPDADMLPLGVISFGRRTRFTPEEQITLMTLWCIARSPLIYGGDLTKMDPFTLSLLTNEEVLEVNQASSQNRQIFREKDRVGWMAAARGSTDMYLALFNIADRPAGGEERGLKVGVSFAEHGLPDACLVRDLWARRDLGWFTNRFEVELPYHGAGLYRLKFVENTTGSTGN